jgi:hypothetical protein
MDWDGGLVEPLRASAAAGAALAMARQAELGRVLEGLTDEGIAPLLIKGAHLASTIYPGPECRPRLDADLLIPERSRARARWRLAALGYVPLPYVTGDIAFSQFQYGRVDGRGVAHSLDVHWRIANPRVFASRLDYEEIARARVAIPALGPAAFGPSPVHALVIACIHRTAHHGNSERLVWLYDIHLLAACLDDEQWADAVALSRTRGLCRVVYSGLEAAGRWIGTAVPRCVLESLRTSPDGVERDIETFLQGVPGPLQIAISDIRRLNGVRPRLTFVREHLLPSPSYIAQKYGSTNRAILPFLYLHRILAGARRWL